jgi:hypothetical protein
MVMLVCHLFLVWFCVPSGVDQFASVLVEAMEDGDARLLPAPRGSACDLDRIVIK